MSRIRKETVSLINPHNDLKPGDKAAAAKENDDFDS